MKSLAYMVAKITEHVSVLKYIEKEKAGETMNKAETLRI